MVNRYSFLFCCLVAFCTRNIEQASGHPTWGVQISPTHGIKIGFHENRLLSPFRNILNSIAREDLGSAVTVENDTFKISVNVQNFTPEEITVKTRDKFVIVEGKSEKKSNEDGITSSYSRQLSNKYLLPVGVDPNGMKSSLSPDGVLTITAPMTQAAPSEHIIPIIQIEPTTSAEVPSQVEGPSQAENQTQAEGPSQAEDPTHEEGPAQVENPTHEEGLAQAEDPTQAEGPSQAEDPTHEEGPAQVENPTH